MTELSEDTPQNNQKDLLKGAAANLFGFIVRLGARLPFLFVVTLLYGKGIFGQYLFAVTTVETLTVIILFGFRRSLFHFLNDDLRQNDKIGVYNSIITAMIACITIATALLIPIYLWKDFLFSLFPAEMARGVFFLLPTAIIYALTEMLLTATRAARNMRYEVTAKSIVEPYVLLVAAVGFFYFNHRENGLFIAYWIMNISIFLYALYAFGRVYHKDVRVWRGFSRAKITAMVVFSAPTATYDLINILTQRIDIYILAAIVSPESLGIYGIALQIVTIVSKIRQSFDPILEPVISYTLKQSSIKKANIKKANIKKASIKKANIEKASQELSRVSRWIFSIQAMIFTMVIFYGNDLLGLFKASGEHAFQTLLLLIAAIIIQGSFGLSELIFLYKKPAVNPLLSFFILLFHAILSYVMSVRFGIMGAAGSLLISYFIAESLRLALVKYFFNTVPLDPKILKPVILSAILFGYLSLLSAVMTLHSISGLFLGIIGGVLVYSFAFFIIAQKEEKFILMKKLGLKKL